MYRRSRPGYGNYLQGIKDSHVGYGVAFGLGFIGLFCFLWFHTTPTQVKVVNHTWLWRIEVERFKPVRYKKKPGYPPRGAYNTQTWDEDASYQDADGNWVYDSDTYSSYTLDEWAHERWLVAGAHNKKPHWPSTDSIRWKPKNVPLTIHGKWERQARQDQVFNVVLLEVGGEERHWEHPLTDVQLWLRVKKGQQHIAHVNHANRIRRFEEVPTGELDEWTGGQ